MSASILPEVVDRLRSIGALAGATLDRVTIGESAVMVELEAVETRSDAVAGARPRAGESARTHRTAGLAHRPPGSAPSTDDTDVETLLQWATQPTDAAMESGATTIETAIGVAAINALSAPFVDWDTGDPMALLDPTVDTITTVGLFRPAFRKFADVDVRVIERADVGDVSAPDGVRVTTVQPEETAAAMAGAEVVFVTGSTLIYGGLERYLAATPTTATVVLIGATASVLPDPAFAAGVDVVAGASVTAPDRVRAAVRADVCGTDLHDAGVEKVFTVNDRRADSSTNQTLRLTDRDKAIDD